MAYRFTDTGKWRDKWFIGLSVESKLLFNYLCDCCDIAGFIEFIPSIWSVETGLSPAKINSCLTELKKGIIISKDLDVIFVKNFLKHQKNYPFNEKNNAHNGIIARFNNYAKTFDITDIDNFILSPSEGAMEGLISPIGNGKGKGKGKKEKKSAFEFYENEINSLPLDADEKLKHEYKSYVKTVTGQTDSIKNTEHFLNIPEQLSFNQFCSAKAKEKELNKAGLFKSKVMVLLNSEKYCKDKKTVYQTIIDYMNKN